MSGSAETVNRVLLVVLEDEPASTIYKTCLALLSAGVVVLGVPLISRFDLITPIMVRSACGLGCASENVSQVSMSAPGVRYEATCSNREPP
jgi:hypothetical protein